MMKVKELIEALQRHDPEKEVKVEVAFELGARPHKVSGEVTADIVMTYLQDGTCVIFGGTKR